MNFSELTSYRKCHYEGVDQLLWVTSDIGAFGNETDGPLYDWMVGHVYFMCKVNTYNTVVQAGGNCGMYAKFYSNYFKNVYTFEPDPLNFYCLDINCKGDKFHKFQGGLGNTNAKFSISNGNTTNVGTHTIRETPGDIQMYKIDDLDLKSCDLIHLDIEGYELKALEGAIQTIQKFNPVVIVENNNGSGLLNNLGYVKFAQSRMDTIYIRNL